MSHPVDRLSAFLEGDLSADDETSVGEHLRGCAECRTVLSDLQEIIRRAGALEDRPPDRDLWWGIARGIGRGDPRVVEFPLFGPGAAFADPREGRRRPGWPGLAAAVVALVSLSGAGAWMLRGALEPSRGVEASPRSGLLPAAASDVAGFETYAPELQELRGFLADYGDRLDPATIRVLERSLSVMDRAIEESLEALESDPANEYLAGHLEGTLRRKVEFLRETATTLRSAT